jgi:hypothetical protein
MPSSAKICQLVLKLNQNTCPLPPPNPLTHTTQRGRFIVIFYDISLPCTSRFSKWYLSLWLSTKTLYACLLANLSFYNAQPISFFLIWSPNDIRCGVQNMKFLILQSSIKKNVNKKLFTSHMRNTRANIMLEDGYSARGQQNTHIHETWMFSWWGVCCAQTGVSCDATLRILVEIYGRYGETSCSHLPSWR